VSASLPPLPRIPGYGAVQMSLRTVNQMEVTVFVNGKAEQFMVDTGASTSAMDEHEAMKDGVKPTTSDSPYGQYSYVMGQRLRTAIIDDLRAGSMDFGRGPIALYSEGRSDPMLLERSAASRKMTGFLGADVLLHYKAIINCRNRQIFFPMGAKASKLGAVVAGMGFIRVPLREENGRELTVPCSLGGKSGRLLIDTGAFTTLLDAGIVSELRMPVQRTKMSFVDFHGHRMDAALARVRDLMIGDYHLPPQNLFVGGEALSASASRIAETRIFGVFGADLLTTQHAIIDLESMSLFLK
jgi:hypothetical protein